MECKSHYHIGPEKLVVISHLIQGNLFRSIDNKTVLKKKGNFNLFTYLCSRVSEITVNKSQFSLNPRG